MSVSAVPTVEADPFGGNHRLRWSKTACSLPESSRRPQLQREWTFHSIDAEDLTNAAIPYRLPRIDTPRDSFCRFEHDPENVWTRHGYQNQIKVPGELGPTVRMLNPPQTYAQAERQMNLVVPKFKNAAITPTMRPVHWTPPHKDIDDVQVYKSMISAVRNKHLELEGNRPEPTPSPISRCESPAKSVKSIHWMLGSNKHPSFDVKGRGRNQGPYSREFTVRCTAPSNWMRMKWGRANTVYH
nr:uncharacterized protein LOC105345256 isoform X3 [Crassostrea gigas]